MKYFFMVDSKDNGHLLVAADKQEATNIIENAGLEIADLYELEPDTFKQPGFLISER
ncbi:MULTISPECIES: hypothetical protein [Tepidanaerobacter]|uniref:hypothetical protein n=1 Tax=Tepidanaerobacter TaxID=499228 RepID=UPI001BD4B4A8|nr:MULTISPECIES: hypothetical protein [Tepidanaerobacter]